MNFESPQSLIEVGVCDEVTSMDVFNDDVFLFVGLRPTIDSHHVYFSKVGHGIGVCDPRVVFGPLNCDNRALDRDYLVTWDGGETEQTQEQEG
jgi:hypothetical protein